MKTFVLIFGLAFGTIGAVITIIVMVTATSESFPFSFDFGMYVLAPSMILGDALGLHSSAVRIPWLAGVVVSLVNTVLCFSIGAIAGVALYYLTRGFKPSDEITG